MVVAHAYLREKGCTICLSEEDGSVGEVAGAEEEEEAMPIPSAINFPGCQDGGGPCPTLLSMGSAHLTWDIHIPHYRYHGFRRPYGYPWL